MAFPVCHKTVFVLDHTPHFSSSCEYQIEFDFTKSRGPGVIPLAPISKSLWTCCVEASIEYCRILWDIYPQGRLVCLFASDSEARPVTATWNPRFQNTAHLMNAFADVGVPPVRQSGVEYSIKFGLQAAVEALSECSDIQHEKRTSLVENANKVLNRGRVICITLLRDTVYIQHLQDYFQNLLLQQNRLATGSDHLIAIHQCDLVLINAYPNNTESRVMGQISKQISPVLTSEVHSMKAGCHLASKLCSLVLHHFDLASTTVTGIPMKEEQNASSSANYDVEIFHPAVAHFVILKANAADVAQAKSVKEGGEYETVTLKWCTPRSSSLVELHYCSCVYRITPVDVNSRPSSCLTNFLLNGRSVLLEMPRKAGGKIGSHMLAAHGGEIFIHTLGTGRSVLEDPPSISEGCGGRVTDYRIPDFCELMKRNRLGPMRQQHLGLDPIERAKMKLERSSLYWPLTISSTCLFNIQNGMENVWRLMEQPELTEAELVECKKAIYSLLAMEARSEPLPSQSVGQRGKGPKREEQYRALWNELELFLKVHGRTDQHRMVLECLLECRNKPLEEDREETVELEQAIRELDRMGKASDKSVEMRRNSVIRATTDSPMSPPPSKRGRPMLVGGGYPRNLLALWNHRVNAEHQQKHVEFAGRVTADGKCAKLYTSLEKEDN